MKYIFKFAKEILTSLVVCLLVLTGPQSFVLAQQTQVKRVNVFIGFTQTPGSGEQNLVRGVGGKVKHSFTLVPAIAANIPEAAVAALQNNPKVTVIEPDITVYAVDAELDAAWGVKKIGSGMVHDGGNKGTGVKVGVIDSGVDYTHPDLDSNYAGGYDFHNGDSDPMDDYGHGSHVSGTIAAEDDGAGVVGVAPEAKVYAYKVLGVNGIGSYSNVVAALEKAVNDGIQITNNSYGSTGDPGSTVKAAFDNSAALGILHIAAAGNSGNTPGTKDNVIYPARWDSLVAVAATDSNDKRANWSSTGPAVEISGPGVSIKSTLPGGGYGNYSGTSMASPHVAGTAALVIKAGFADVRGRMNSTVVDLGSAGRDTHYGYGRVDAAAAASSTTVNEAPAVTIDSPSDGSSFSSGTAIDFSGSASDPEDGGITASLVWKSDIDGQIGTGASFSATLSDGTHTITATASDSLGKTGSSSITVTVGTTTSPTSVKVDSITYRLYSGPDSQKHLDDAVSIVDNLGNPVSGASVSIELKNATTGQSWPAAASTDSSGKVTFSLKNAPSGCYTTDVIAISAGSLTFDGTEPANGVCK